MLIITWNHSHLCELVPFSQNTGVSSDRVEYQTLVERLTGASLRFVLFPSLFVISLCSFSLVIRGLTFKRSGFFVNTARIDPDVVTVDPSRRLKIAASSHNAVGIMIGVVTECYLVEEGTLPYPVHKVTIVPFAQDMRHDTALWGQVFGFRSITASISPDGMSFLTRKQGSYVSTSTPSSPKKKSALVKTVSSPMISRGEGSRTTQSYPVSRGFEEKSLLFCI